MIIDFSVIREHVTSFIQENGGSVGEGTSWSVEYDYTGNMKVLKVGPALTMNDTCSMAGNPFPYFDGIEFRVSNNHITVWFD